VNPRLKQSKQDALKKVPPSKYFFKIVLDGPLIERTQSMRKTAVTDRKLNGSTEAFEDCNVDRIEQNSELIDTVILNNDEDKRSILFDDEGSTVFKMS
jgi:hypothetical protein